MPDGWQVVSLIFPRRSIEGRLIWGEVMRRRVRDKWQYREMTEQEDHDAWRDQQW